MGCGCGGSKTGITGYSYTTPDGQTTTNFPTRLEARAQMIRAGDRRSPDVAITPIVKQPA